jgi:phosphoglycerate dehydrogenase-like enzyme
LIQLTSSGLDRIPLNDIKSRSVRVTNAKGIYSIPMAEWALLKILEIYKNTRFFEGNQKDSIWNKNRQLFELYNKTIGVIGTGSVGIEVAKRAKAFGTKVIGLNTSGTNKEYFDYCMIFSELNTFLKECDVVVLTLPLTKQTVNMINKDNLGCLKKDAIIINIARGEVINEADLLNHLNKGELKGVALDVFAEEPLPSDNPLWNHPRVIVTPHNSFVSDNISNRMFDLIYYNLASFIESKPLKNEIVTL